MMDGLHPHPPLLPAGPPAGAALRMMDGLHPHPPPHPLLLAGPPGAAPMMGYILPYTEETYLSLVDGGGSPHAMRRSLSRRSTQDAIAEEGLEGDYEVGLWARGDLCLCKL